MVGESRAMGIESLAELRMALDDIDESFEVVIGSKAANFVCNKTAAVVKKTILFAAVVVFSPVLLIALYMAIGDGDLGELFFWSYLVIVVTALRPLQIAKSMSRTLDVYEKDEVGDRIVLKWKEAF